MAIFDVSRTHVLAARALAARWGVVPEAVLSYMVGVGRFPSSAQMAQAQQPPQPVPPAAGGF